jgi:ribosomal protein S18 acetylase RimI-like enzyme
MIRRAVRNDIDAVVALDLDQRRVLIAARFQAGCGRIAETGSGELVAFAIVTDELFFQRPFIELIVVRPDQRRRRIARAMLRQICNEHRGARVFTSTNESNEPMRRLLAAVAFTPAGVIHGLDADDPELVFYFDAS